MRQAAEAPFTADLKSTIRMSLLKDNEELTEDYNLA